MTTNQLISKNPNNTSYKGGSKMTNGMFFTIKSKQHMYKDQLKPNHILVTGEISGLQYIANVCNGFCYPIIQKPIA